ncbi:MAG: ligand-binding sensor domain-containing protein [Candidatus Zixiibacteriota bacterium]
MKRRLTIFVLAVLTVLLLMADLSAFRLKDQAVTFADFKYIKDIASSMSHTYFATTEGLIRYNKLERRWELPLTGSDGMANEEITRVWVNTFDDKLFISTRTQKYEYEQSFDRWYPVDEVPFIQNDCRYLSTDADLLPPFRYNMVGRGALIDPYARSYAVSNIVDDNTGSLWIGFWGYGPATASSSSKLVELLPYGLLQNRVNAIYMDDSLLWLSGAIENSPRSGVTAFDPDNNTFSYIESGVESSFPAVDVNCLEGDEKNLYIGTEYGLYVLNKATREITRHYRTNQGLIDNSVISLKKIGDSLFVGTAAGLTLIHHQGELSTHIRPKYFSNRIIYDMEPVGSSLWLATSIGAFRYSLKDDRLQKFNDPEMTFSDEIYSLAFYDKYLWFATFEGVVRLDTETGEIRSFVALTRNINGRALAVNNDICAVASDKGMTFIFPRDDKFTSREFTTDDGLPSNYVYDLVLDGDFIWVGTDRGLTRFWWNNPSRVD